MDKQLVEEMAKDLKTAGLFAMDWLCAETKQIVKEHGLFNSVNHTKSMYEIMAEELIKKNYCKIPEGAVVLTGTETEERLEDLLVEFDEMSFYPATLMPNAEECAREWKRKLIYAIGQLKKEMLKDCIESNKVARETYYKQGSKETAEKFAERLKDEVLNFCGTVEVNGYFERGKRGFCHDIDEICKEITGGK